ncbi:hypothetical protein [Falsibacillus pallidus]|uniref:hypothetical protein n=1 Tax=Falsibacillus pallidus TaxID=493781 RepID=UPI003D9779CB
MKYFISKEKESLEEGDSTAIEANKSPLLQVMESSLREQQMMLRNTEYPRKKERKIK